MNEAYRTLDTPIGALGARADTDGIVTIDWPGATTPDEPSADASSPAQRWLRELADQLTAYFGGECHCFDITIAASGTPFQHTVWAALREIPYGETRSYGEIARAIGRPRAARAVGAATGANPVPLIVPCHRVLGADGRLTGFAGGLATKRRLLDFEAGRRSIAAAIA